MKFEHQLVRMKRTMVKIKYSVVKTGIGMRCIEYFELFFNK